MAQDIEANSLSVQVINTTGVNVNGLSIIEYVKYPLNTDGTIKDRMINVVSSNALSIPEGYHDLLIRFCGISANEIVFLDTDIETSTHRYGDSVHGLSSNTLITVTKINNNPHEAYVRAIKLEVPTT